MALSFLNTLTREKEEFTSVRPGEVLMYTCGPTVYDYPHVGNYRAYAFEDLLRRHLVFKGYRVKQVMNITDVEDKIIRSSRREGVMPSEYTKKYIEAFFADLETLNIEKAEVYPRATEHIPEMVALIGQLLESGLAYRSEDGSVYFSIASFPSYGRLAHIKVEDLLAGARVKQDEYEKARASDFALWKAWDEDDGEVFWETELGKGRPGWHIECSAMALKHLSTAFESGRFEAEKFTTIDIHTGGVDNIFPHHENEIAQSEGATGKKFVNYWLHCEHLLVNGEKMSKSLGNIVTLKSLNDEGFTPMVLRYFYVSNHYRSKINYTKETMEAARNTLQGLLDFMKRLGELPEKEGGEPVDEIVSRALREFTEAMDDDLNSPQALAALFGMVRDINVRMASGGIGKEGARKTLLTLLSMDKVLGLGLDEALLTAPELPEDLKGLIDERENARREKNWKRSDEIRDLLKARGITLEDTPGGVRWKQQCQK
jgi:cysteinyl-tRNA synthetase